MTPHWIAITSFVVGVLAETLLLIKVQKNSQRKITGVFFLAFLIFAISSKDHTDNLTMLLLISCIIFSMLVAYFFAKDIIPMISEKTLLAINLVTIYSLIKSGLPWQILLIYGVISLGTIINALVPKKAPRWIEILLFIWYFFLIITIPILHFKINDFVYLFSSQTTSIPYDQAAILGTIFCFITVHIFFLLSLIPRPDRHTTFKQAARRVKDIFIKLHKNYNHEQLTTVQASVFITSITFLLTINYSFSLISDSLLIIISLLLITVVGKILPQKNN